MFSQLNLKMASHLYYSTSSRSPRSDSLSFYSDFAKKRSLDEQCHVINLCILLVQYQGVKWNERLKYSYANCLILTIFFLCSFLVVFCRYVDWIKWKQANSIASRNDGAMLCQWFGKQNTSDQTPRWIHCDRVTLTITERNRMRQVMCYQWPSQNLQHLR